MWIVNFTSESGDDYIFGPWENVPSLNDIMSLVRKYIPDEIEMMEGVGMSCFIAVRLPENPGCINFQSGCERVLIETNF